MFYLLLFLLFISVFPLISHASQNQSITPSASSSQQLVPTVLVSTQPSEPEPVVTTPREFKGTFTITNFPWKPEFANVKSADYKNLKASLETELNNALENAISGFVMCVVQWFIKGSVITHFAVYVNGNHELNSEKLQNILLGAWSSNSLASYSLEKITVEAEQTQDEQATEATIMFLKWELWKIISLGAAVIVFILLIVILVLIVSLVALVLELFSVECRKTKGGKKLPCCDWSE